VRESISVQQKRACREFRELRRYALQEILVSQRHQDFPTLASLVTWPLSTLPSGSRNQTHSGRSSTGARTSSNPEPARLSQTRPRIGKCSWLNSSPAGFSTIKSYAPETSRAGCGFPSRKSFPFETPVKANNNPSVFGRHQMVADTAFPTIRSPPIDLH
jgi:hypothetical protein